MGSPLEFCEKGALNFPAGNVLHVQHSALGVSAFSSKIRLTMPGNLPLVEVHSDFLQLADRFRSFGHDCAHDLLVTKSDAGLECIANVQFKGIFTARHASNAAFSRCCIRGAPLSLGDDSDRTVLGGSARETHAGDSAADHNKIEFLHAIRRLSINRVSPIKTARARTAFGRNVCSGSKVSASIKLM